MTPLWARLIRITAAPDAAAEAIAGHLAHLRDLRDRGVLRGAGAFPGGDGFLDLYEAADLRDAEAIARSSPLVDTALAAWSFWRWDEIGDIPQFPAPTGSTQRP